MREKFLKAAGISLGLGVISIICGLLGPIGMENTFVYCTYFFVDACVILTIISFFIRKKDDKSDDEDKIN